MNDRQNTVVTTVVAGLVTMLIFLCPSRIESFGEVKWSPIYQYPITYVQSAHDATSAQGSFLHQSHEAEIAFDIILLQVLALGLAGGAVYVYNSDSTRDKELSTPQSVD